MNLIIRPGTNDDINGLANLYNDIHDYLENTINHPGWKRGVYPVEQDAVNGFNEGCLYVATINDKLAGSMILRHKPEPAYLSASWQATLDYDSVLVIYTFVVSPFMLKQGIGKSMLDFAYSYGQSNHMKALRLDVYENNAPAIKLYEKCGFQYIDTVSLGLEAYGLNFFRLYEKLIV